MLIKELEIENIRSYTKAKINFPSGITLFEGDIGSGKSTILYGIEFALFGSSDIPPSFLLRNGKNRGEVKLTFDVDGKEYKIHRALIRKNGSISQTGCWIETSGLRTEYSPTEMRKEVLNILQFNEPPNVRSSSVIYRYAVFTPQEEMKEILTKNEEERLQTLRKALRIEEYKIAKDNTAFLVREIGKKCEYLKGECMDLEARKREMEKKREAYEKGILEINVSKENVKKLKAEVEELGKRKEEGELHINLLRNLEEKKKILEIKLEKANEKFVEINAELENIKIYEDRIKEIETKVFELKNMKANRDSMEIEYRKKMKLMGEIGVLEEKMNVLNERKKKIDKRKRDMDVMLAQREKIGHIDELLGNEREKLNKIMDERTKILMELKNIGIELRKLEKEKNEYSTFVEGSACPKCGQLLSREHINKIFREIEKNYDELIKNKDLLEIRREEK
ncbi:MAG: SMC family ATPase, partial [Candidatus Thermoplasmatota archaeon]